MDLHDLGEYVKDKSWVIALGLGVVGIFLTLTAFQGLVWMSAAAAIFFLIIYPHVRTKNRWHLYSRQERIFQVGFNVFMTGYGAYLIVLGLMTKGISDLSSNFGLLGGFLVLPFGFILIEENVPQWVRSRKECPDCYRTTHVTAKACPCGHHWPQEDAAGNLSDPA
jgi:hypothetical protein